MPNQTIEPRLEAELRRRESAGSAAQPVSVLIQVQTQGTPGETTSYDQLSQRLTRPKQQIVARLREHGYRGDPLVNLLAGSIEVELIAEQIRAVADLDAVKRIVWNRADHVALTDTAAQ